MTTDVEIEIALDRRSTPVDVRILETLGTLSRKRAELLELGQHDPAHVHRQGERRQTLMRVEPLRVIVEHEDNLILDVYLRKPFGTYAAQMAVTAIPIVKDFDVVKDIRPRQIARLVDAFLDALFLQAAEEGFGHGVVPAIATSAHAGLQLM